ncbi:hypothetical protein GLAREA_04637 [Glarea lozoyensis ATCC 20868]|uniref:Uncharacterized protein n=1 Tax=Glarea lozoyensis (strain ATCC 20868 / MF5171) TaxID=1116229 RepID=S3D768_GLAL2|nr:uncharacterized protein GLAREA_04637 [Glarea lozoyensis ATCC 20868]EPE27846.1 hypothetical protein GLAREA_04637 [Glarea lozoyensis ATCC 20868]
MVSDVVDLERGDDGVMALAGRDELLSRHGRRDHDVPHGRARRRQSIHGATQQGDLEACSVEEGLEDESTKGAVCSDQEDFRDGSRLRRRHSEMGVDIESRGKIQV